MHYNYTCGDCKKDISGETTGTYDVGDNITCPFCGRVLSIYMIEAHLFTDPTSEKKSPSEYEKLEQYKKDKNKD